MTSFRYDHIFDACVLGAGWAGFAAVRALRRAGWSVLLIDPEFAPLHEGGRAGLIAAGEDEDPDWRAWLAELATRGGVRDGCIDPAVAEIGAAAWLLDDDAQLAVLGQAQVIALERDEAGLIAALGVATKAGALRVAARHHLDASEAASLARLVDPTGTAALRAPAAREHACFLQHRDWPQVGPIDPGEHAGFRLRLESTVWPSERRLAIISENGRDLAAAEAAVLDHLRTLLPAAVRDAVVSHVSQWPGTRYAAGAVTGLALPANLALAVPGLDPAPCASLADRYALGRRAAERLLEAPPAHCRSEGEPPAPSFAQRRARVVVAGAGTGGAMAAIAAAEHGAEVLALDPQPLPGGVGTGGLILGYCAGAEGGAYQAIDAAADGTTARFGERYRGRHAVAKGRALAARLAAAGGALVSGALVYGVERTGRRVTAVLAATAEGPLRIACESVIDATGDGDLCAAAGCEHHQGRPGDGMALPYTQSASRIVLDREGRLQVSYTNYDAGWCDPRDPGDLSRARLLGIAQFQRPRYADEQLRVTCLAPVLGLRQSRQVDCDATLTLDQVATGARCADSIGPVRAYLDSHNVDFAFEDDEMLAWQWLMRAFRTRIGCELPYRCLLPRALDNAWIACRAAGFTPTAASCARMQRDIQRIGEAAGIAAALAPEGEARAVPIAELQARLRASGALAELEDTPLARGGLAAGLAAMTAGARDAALWFVLRDPASHRERAMAQLDQAGDPGFVAACLLALWGDAQAEPVLLRAIAERHEGPPPEPHQNGAFKQLVIVPDWLLALCLLRRCGTAASLEPLAELAAQPRQLHDLRCMIALSLEGIAARHEIPGETVEHILAALTRDEAPDRVDAHSRSLWRRLRGETQAVLGNDQGSDTRADHGWQLELVVDRIRSALGVVV